jgi:hypothetical protein
MDVDVNLISMEPDVVNFSRNYESSPSPHYGKILKGMAGTNFHVFAMPVQMRKTYIGEDRQVTIAAEYRGQRMTAVVPVIWPRAISSLVISPPNQGGVNMATLTLDRPAPAGGITLAINTSNRPGFLNLPNTVRVEAGQTTGTFSLSLKPPYGAQAGVTVTVTAVPYWNSSVTSPVPVH